MNCMNSIDNLILMLITAAEYCIQQTKIGDYRLQLTVNGVFEYYQSKNMTLDDNFKIVAAKLVEQIFERNRKKLLKLASDLFDLGDAIVRKFC